MVHLFEREVTRGWVYPCSVEEIREKLQCVPPSDLEGLWAVGLVPSTRKDSSAHGRYWASPKPVIHLYSFPDNYELRLGTRMSEAIRSLQVDQNYGMRLIARGRRAVSKWEPDDLGRLIVEHVLLHEIGHHVCHTRRLQAGLRACPGNRTCEQFAEAYALRMRPAPIETNTPHRQRL